MRTPCSGRSFLIVALGIGALSGCSIFGPEEACTLRGCASGLTVQLTSLPTEPYSVEVLAPGTGPQQVLAAYECDGGSSCLQKITFLHGAYGDSQPTLPYILVRVTTVAGSRVTEFPDIHYGRTYPNGRSCDPCPDATVTAEVPA